MDMVLLFKGLSDPIRLRIFHALVVKGELCVCHLTDALELPQSTISRHLSVLKNSGLVNSEREGKWIYYFAVSSEADVNQLAKIVKAYGKTDALLQEDLIAVKDNIC